MRAKMMLATFSVMSMAIQPLALAEQKKNWSGEVLREFVRASQPKGKSLTVKQFWDQNKAELNPVWQNRFAPAIEIQKNDRLPKMEVINIKAPQGVESARLMMSIDGKVVSVEYLGGREKFARINNTVISYQDFYYVTGMVEKLMKDPIFANEQKKLEKSAIAQTFVPTRKQFNQMSVAQRVEMIMKLRLASEAADKVITLNLEGGVKTSQNLFWDLVLPVAHAKTQAQINAALGKSCLIAGHVGTFQKDKSNYASCTVPNEVITSKSCNPKRPHGCNKLFFPRSGDICLSPARVGSDRQDYQNFTAKCAAATPISSAKDKADFVKAAQADLRFELKGEKVEASDEDWAKLSTFMESHNRAIDETLKTACSDSNVAVVGRVETNLGSACNALKDRKLDLVRYQAETVGGGAPTPAPTPAPGADGSPCSTKPVVGDSGDEKHDGQLKDGKCIAVAVPVAAGEAATGDCAKQNKCDGTDGAGKRVCAPCGDRVVAGGVTAGGKKEPSFLERNKNWMIPVGIFAGLFLVMKRLFKAGDTGGPQPGNPPAPPPLEPIPAPVIPNPVTPITPVAPGGSEGGVGTGGAGTPDAPASGQR